MTEVEKDIKEKQARLEKLVKARSKAYCSTVLSSEADVLRENEIEELEEEIQALQQKLERARS